MYLTGVGVGETTLFAVDDNDNVLMSTPHPRHPQHQRAAGGHPQHGPGPVGDRRRTVDQSLVLTGTVANAEQAANVLQVANQFVDDPTRVVNRLTVAAPTQVNLQVRIAEVARNVDRQLGIQWNDVSVGINGGRVGFSGGSGGAGRLPGQLRRGPRQLQHRRGAAGAGGGGAGHHHGRAEPDRALGRAGDASWPAASIPYSTVSDDGTNVQFKDFGIGLNFTPTVIDGNRISLTVGDRGQRARLRQEPETVPSLQHPPGRDDGRPRQRPELRHRRADAELLVAERLARAGARHDPGARRALPLARPSSAARASSSSS